MEWFILAGVALGAAVVIGVVIGGNSRRAALMDDDFPVQNDFGVSMDRFGYVQDARNGGRQ